MIYKREFGSPEEIYAHNFVLMCTTRRLSKFMHKIYNGIADFQKYYARGPCSDLKRVRFEQYNAYYTAPIEIAASGECIVYIDIAVCRFRREKKNNNNYALHLKTHILM